MSHASREFFLFPPSFTFLEPPVSSLKDTNLQGNGKRLIMELILTHTRADFDAFSSMLCAARLFPEAIPILPSTSVFKLREVLSLYRDIADFQYSGYLKKLKKYDIERVIVVDTKKHGKLKEFESCLNKAGRHILIFDHHPPTSDDLTLGLLEQYPYGANTTGLFFKLREEKIQLTPEEATIALLGIYADTGNLTYPGTTAADAEAVSELLRQGADLQTVNHYLRPFYDPTQRSVFREMLSSLQEMDMDGYNVVLVKQELDEPVQGLSALLANASDMVGADAIVGVFCSKKKPGVQLIIQSLVSEIHAVEIISHFEGGGHPGAAAAFLPQGDMETVAETLVGLLTEVPLPSTRVKDIMTRSVFTLTPDLSVREAAAALTEKGIHGAPVLNEAGDLVGVLSLRDAEKAALNNLLHAPTTGFMSHKVTTIGPEAPLITAKKLISSRDIGRLPVMEDGRLVGIISRADILKMANGSLSGLNDG
jgi:tRNA nucleotidyltransferase (CCA-adding enzyme)